MERIIEILKRIRPDIDVESMNFIEDGSLDSLDTLRLISELEEKYSITIESGDIVPENFANIDAISKLINRLKSA